MLKLKNYIVTLSLLILISLLIHVAYDVAAAMKSFDDLEFYVAFIGGGLTMLIYRNMCKGRRVN